MRCQDTWTIGEKNSWITVKSLIFAGILFRVFVILSLQQSKMFVFGRAVI
jgi:hypothetical protein